MAGTRQTEEMCATFLFTSSVVWRGAVGAVDVVVGSGGPGADGGDCAEAAALLVTLTRP